MTADLSLALLDFPLAMDPPFAMAKVAERLGYSRYWLTEHYESNPGSLGSSLISASVAASVTTSIRVGTAAILLRFYPTALAAIQLRSLSALFPGRIDAGFCSGGAVNRDSLQMDLQDWDFASKTERFVADTRSPTWPPPEAAPPSLWYVGGGRSARRAGSLGVNFGYGLQFQHNRDEPGAIAEYRDTFVPGPHQEAPGAVIAVAGFCSDSAADATRHVDASLERWAGGMHPTVVGTPATCRDRLLQLAERYAVDEIVFVNLCREWAPACRSLELLADALTLSRRG